MWVKRHFGAETTQSADPSALGFDVNIAGAANGGPASYLAENEYGAGRFHVNGLEKYYGTDTFLTEALTLEALDAIKKPIDEEKPFFLYMSHYAIHVPYDADKRFTANYEGVTDPMLGEPLSKPEINHASLVEGMDKSLGDILDFLDERPEVAQNTVIIFMSDNGGHSIAPRQGRIDHDQNYPARAGKGSALEGGVHEPMIVAWPGQVAPGTVNSNRVMIEDFFPAILDMAGAGDYSTVQTVDGVSFKDLLLDPSINRDRPTVWHFPQPLGRHRRRDPGLRPLFSPHERTLPLHLLLGERQQRALQRCRRYFRDKQPDSHPTRSSSRDGIRAHPDAQGDGRPAPSLQGVGSSCALPDER